MARYAPPGASYFGDEVLAQGVERYDEAEKLATGDAVATP
jgi:hypothetical protein